MTPAAEPHSHSFTYGLMFAVSFAIVSGLVLAIIISRLWQSLKGRLPLPWLVMLRRSPPINRLGAMDISNPNHPGLLARGVQAPTREEALAVFARFLSEGVLPTSRGGS